MYSFSQQGAKCMGCFQLNIYPDQVEREQKAGISLGYCPDCRTKASREGKDLTPAIKVAFPIDRQ